MSQGPDRPPAAGQSVYFLSDYGLRDEFVGVVHAVLHRLAPEVIVTDLTHGIEPFDVRAGAAALMRSQPHLGPGVVLGVVDPGVGGARRGVALEVPASSGPRYFVGPDNGLLLPAAEAAGGIVRAVEVRGDRSDDSSVTFDGRDLFAPAAAALSRGTPLDQLGPRVPVDSLVQIARQRCERGTFDDGRQVCRAEVTWVDRFGNVQTAAEGSTVPLGAVVDVVEVSADAAGAPSATQRLRRVRAFSELASGEAGLLSDANGRLALVVREGSAAGTLGVASGDLVVLAW